MLTVCLVCFSIARDDAGQWKRYGDNGRGVCLGIRVLAEPPPTGLPGALVTVDYPEPSWRDNVTKCFQEICSILTRAQVSTENIRMGLNALDRIAAHASISAKQRQWSVEREFRRVTLVPGKCRQKLKGRQSAGKTQRYLSVSVRAEGKRIALAEIMVGPNQNVDDVREGLEVLLAENGYTTESPEYPKITVSQVPPWVS